MKGPFSEASRSAQGLTAGRRRRWASFEGRGSRGAAQSHHVLSGCSLWGGRGNRDGWEGGLREVGDAGHAFPRKLPKGLLAEGEVWSMLLLIPRATVHWGTMAVSPRDYSPLPRKAVSESTTICGRRRKCPPLPRGGQAQGSPHPTVGPAAKALHVVSGVAQVWDNATAEGDPGPAGLEHQCGGSDRGKFPETE